MVNNEIRFGVIGCGLMGREFASASLRWMHLQGVNTRPRIVAVCDSNQSARDWFVDNVPGIRLATTDYHELLADPDIDAIYCAVPHNLHQQMYVDIIRAGKHLLGEKPFGIDRTANMAIMSAIAENPNVLVRCSSEFPYFPGAYKIANWIRDERFGQIIEVEAGFWHSSDLDPNKTINWKRQIATNGEYGCMGDLGIHALHIPLRSGWVPKSVRALLKKVVSERPDARGQMVACETWDNAILACDVQTGNQSFPMMLSMKRIAPGHANTWYIRINGTHLSAEFSTKNPKQVSYLPYQSGGEQSWRTLDVPYQSAYETITGHIFEFGFSDAILQMWAAFCDELVNSRAMKQPLKCVTPEEASITHEIFTAALESHRTGQTISIGYEVMEVMTQSIPSVIVAGHVCLDIIPEFTNRDAVREILIPGHLVEVGAAMLTTGGAVPNTGIALHKLGIPTHLIGKVGDDFFGRAILEHLHAHHPSLTDDMVISTGENSSYTVVINPPNVDRIFMHHPGANDTFGADDVDLSRFTGAGVFHFGYPPLMKLMYANDGQELETIFCQVKRAGITTSLDMAWPDPQSMAGQANWSSILRRVLPYVDVFLPSFDEILYMLNRPKFDALQKLVGQADFLKHISGEMLSELADRVLDWGCGLVGIKLGDQGFYMRTSADRTRLGNMGGGFPVDVDLWLNRELLVPCFSVDVVGTTGAGDCTVAGFLASLLNGMDPEQTLIRAVAVGAFNVEAADATSGIHSWEAVERRLASEWKQRATDCNLHDWIRNERTLVWQGPNDRKS